MKTWMLATCRPVEIMRLESVVKCVVKCVGALDKTDMCDNDVVIMRLPGTASTTTVSKCRVLRMRFLGEGQGQLGFRAVLNSCTLNSGFNVKSTSPTTENWLRKLCTDSMKDNMSDEDNKHDTNHINKHKYTNHDTRKLHL